MASRIAWAVALGLLGFGGCSACTLLSERRAPKAAGGAKAAPTHREPGHLEAVEVVFDGKLGAGWDDWGWGPHELKEGHPARISFGGYGGIILHHSELPSRFGGLSFRFLAPPGFGDFLEASLQYRQVDEQALPPAPILPRHIAELPGGWAEVLIPWAELNPGASPFDRIQIRARTPVSDEPVSIDKVVLTKGEPGARLPTGPSRPVELAIRCEEQATPINPLIYGIAADIWATGATGHRMGGNPLTRLNWDLGNVWNTGADWYFENVVGAKTKLPEWIDADVEHGVKTALVVPMIGWVAKDTTSVGFPVSKLGPQRAHDPYRPEAGDGFKPDGSEIAPGPPTETSVPAPPEVIARWIGQLRERDRARGKRGVDMYILDNEPNLWSSTHRDVHPAPVTYDELLDRTVRYGSAIRRADPEGVIAGPAEWGWSAYFFSAKDLAKGAVPHADQAAHGGVPLLSWYLKKLLAHEKRTGTHILDVVDVHYYPQGPGMYGGNAATDSDASARRLRATRALWDPTYVDESWINDRIGLIPRLKKWISESYPGRGISIGEWSFGAEQHISGGLSVAEVLGRFGQQGITSAFYWVGPPPGSPAFVAFRAFRNYDGKGGRFLDWSVPTREAPDVSLFASRDESGAHVTAVLLNLDPNAIVQANIDVSRCGTIAARRAFSYTSGAPSLVEEAKVAASQPVSETLAPYSIKVLELTVSQAKAR